MDPAPLSIRLFGAFEVRVAGEAMRSVRTRSVEWLLALLVLRHGREVSRSWLAGTLWPESREAQAYLNLRRNLMDLRRALGPEAGRLLSPSSGTLLLDLTDASADVVEFDAAIQVGDEPSLQRAISLYRGPLLESCVEEWALPERASRTEACLRALETLADRAVERREWEAALGYLVQAEALDPLRDSTQRRRMQALAAGGDLPAAVLSYRDYRLRLHREMNLEPDAETVRLFQQLRATARRTPLPAPSPPLPASRVPALTPSSLPRPLTDLVGREEEVREVVERLSTSRLVTLVGGGGVGKTRLALEVAARTDDRFSAPAVWVELASLADGALVLPAVAAALGSLEDAAGDASALMTRLVARLSDDERLLVIDNCEHLLDAVAAVVQTLLQRCPHLRVLTTSRQRLGLAGEIAWRVPSLPAPDPARLPAAAEDAIAEVRRFPAAQLFLERAAAANPAFRLRTHDEAKSVGLICRRLDGIPLALELAAPRARVLTLQQIAERLDDRFSLLTSGGRGALPRHRTLRALIDWSYDSLPEAEGTLLRRLSVFAGGWTLEAAEAVCSDFGFWILDFGLPTTAPAPDDWTSLTLSAPIQNPKSKIQNSEVLDLLDSLVDRSLMLVEEAGEGLRYRMLETVREYAAEKLVASGEQAAVRDRHRDCYLQMARQTASPVMRRSEWVDRLERELDNFRAALAWCFETVDGKAVVSGQWSVVSGDKSASGTEASDVADLTTDHWPLTTAGEAGLLLAVALSWLSERRGFVPEGLRWLEEALERGPDAPPAARARAFHRACALAKDRGNHEQFTAFLELARREQEKAVALARAAGDQREIAYAVLAAAQMFQESPDLELIWSYAAEARERMRAVGDPVGLVHSLEWLTVIAFRRGGREAARPVVEEWLAICRELGEPELLLYALNAMAELAGGEGDYARARALSEERLVICRELGNPNQLIHALGAAGHLARNEGGYARARTLYAESLALRQQHNYRPAIAQSLEDLAALARREGQSARSIRLLGAGEAFCETLGLRPPVAVPEEYERTVSEGRAALGEAAFAAAWAEGRAMSLDQAIAYALGDA